MMYDTIFYEVWYTSIYAWVINYVSAHMDYKLWQASDQRCMKSTATVVNDHYVKMC